MFAALNNQHFNSLPHTEVDPDTLKESGTKKHFNSLPHTEVDEKAKGESEPLQDISTHYLTQR